MNKDRIKGMIIGAALGDALGLPHEFKTSKHIYTGKLEFQAIIPSRFHQYIKTLPIGSISDDTEMSLIIIRSLIKHKCYKVDEVCLDYMYWANGSLDDRVLLSKEERSNVTNVKPSGMGINTRKLFVGIKTLKGYKNRSHKIFSKEISLSNGALMRSYPLALLPDYTALTQDTNLSNPDAICLDCSYIHNTILRYCLNTLNPNKQDISNVIVKVAQTQETKNIIQSVLNKQGRDVKSQKGYVLHALYCCLYALFHFESYIEAVDYIIRLGGDTDTNASISGSILGAYYGYNHLISNPITLSNINIMLACTSNITGRPRKYSIDDILELCDELTEITFNKT